MRRRPTHAAHGNHERWLVSYADFITLLFAFFVLMFANSQTDKGKAREVSEAVKAALDEGSVQALVTGLVKTKGQLGQPPVTRRGDAPAPAASPPSPDLLPSWEKLQEDLDNELKAGAIKLTLDQRGLTISLQEAAFFAPGEAVMAAGTYETLAKVADAVRPLSNRIRLEGHTDATPVRSLRYRNNWELASARSLAMLDFFSGRGGIQTGRLAVAGYGDTMPVDANDTPEGRARNRRVDVVILSQLAGSRQ